MKQWLKTCAVAFASAVLLSGPSIAADQVVIELMDSGEPIVGAEVILFASYGMFEGLTDEAGLVEFELEEGKGFWLEVNGERVAQFFDGSGSTYEVDVTAIGTIEWPGR